MSGPTAIVAEDEATLRHHLVEQLGQLWPELRIVGEAADGVQALRLLDEHQPDVLFLDIQMPGATGLEVARQANGRCHVVFVTAYDQHAVAAFDQGAVDYVLKPVSAARLFTAVSRLKQRLGSPPARIDSALGSLATVAPNGSARQPLRWINASVGQNLKLITVDEITYFQADNKYTRVVTVDGEALIRKPLKELVEELDPVQFWQIHRSTLVERHRHCRRHAGLSRPHDGEVEVAARVAAGVRHLYAPVSADVAGAAHVRDPSGRTCARGGTANQSAALRSGRALRRSAKARHPPCPPAMREGIDATASPASSTSGTGGKRDSIRTIG